MVVDYRALNRASVKKVFIIPNSDQIKGHVAGSQYFSVGDAKEGFNQCENEAETLQEMAVLVASGSYLPKGLTFGPTNGPEDFQELVFVVFPATCTKSGSFSLTICLLRLVVRLRTLLVRLVLTTLSLRSPSVRRICLLLRVWVVLLLQILRLMRRR